MCSSVIHVDCASFNHDTHKGSLCIICCALAKRFLQIRGCRCTKHLSYCPLMAAGIHHNHIKLVNSSFTFFRIILWQLLVSLIFLCTWWSNQQVLQRVTKPGRWKQVASITLLWKQGMHSFFTSCPSLSRLSSACAATVDSKQRRRCSVSLLQGGSKNIRSCRALSWSE